MNLSLRRLSPLMAAPSHRKYRNDILAAGYTALVSVKQKPSRPKKTKSFKVQLLTDRSEMAHELQNKARFLEKKLREKTALLQQAKEKLEELRSRLL